MSFQVPARAINSFQDLEQFKTSETYKEFVTFVHVCNEAVIGVRATTVSKSPEGAAGDIISDIVAMLTEMEGWIDSIPPADEPMRFGNKAFRSWYQRLENEADMMMKRILGPSREEAVVELAPYFLSSFGHPSRIDYGTGHETTFVVWLCCLHKLRIFKKEDLASVVLRVFSRYLKVMHNLQTVYMLEPAGSHGVWGLDDYHCLPFLWGSAQLIDHESITPSKIHDEEVLSHGRKDFLYLDSIAFIRGLKKGASFAEYCPMLDDISRLSSWRKVNSGMKKLYEGDVLGKLPVIQHFLFGSILPCTWKSLKTPEAKPRLHDSDVR